MMRLVLWRFWAIGGLVGYAVVVLLLTALGGLLAAGSASGQSLAATFAHPTNSSPIALSQDNSLVWVVNPDDDSVSVINAANNTLIKTIGVGDEPQSVALDPNSTLRLCGQRGQQQCDGDQDHQRQPAQLCRRRRH